MPPVRGADTVIDRYLPARQSFATKPLHVAALISIDGTDRRTGGRTDTRPLHRRLLGTMQAALIVLTVTLKTRRADVRDGDFRRRGQI